MRILHVIAGAKVGGAEAAFLDTITAMKSEGMEVMAVMRQTPMFEKGLNDASIDYRAAKFGGKLDFITPRKIREAIKEFRPDIVQTWMSRASDKTPRWSKSMGVAPYTLVARLGGYYDLKYYKNTQHFIGNTPDIADYLRGEGINDDHVHQINNLVPVETAENVDIKAMRAEYGVTETDMLLITLGRLHPVKAQDILIRAMADFPNCHLWVAGEGPERSNLQHLIDSNDLGDRVKLLGWRDDRAALFACADICVFPSRFEPFGNVFAQSWAYKVPLITSSSEGPSQYVRDEQDCLVFPVDDIDALKDCLERLISDKSLSKKLVENGHKRYQNEFTTAQTIKSYRDLYSRIIADGQI